MNEVTDFQARDKARQALENTETLDIVLTALRAEVAKLEERVKTLEAFHHWATTQAIPLLGEKLKDHELIFGRIERNLAKLVDTVMPLPNHPSQEQFGPDLTKYQCQGNNPPANWTQGAPASFAGDPRELMQQTYEHITNHPPFTSQVVLDERPIAFDDPINPHTLVQEPAVCRICGGRASQHDSCYAPPSYKLVHESCLEKELAGQHPNDGTMSQSQMLIRNDKEMADPGHRMGLEREPGEQDKSKA